jgi:hypothetical protein
MCVAMRGAGDGLYSNMNRALHRRFTGAIPDASSIFIVGDEGDVRRSAPGPVSAMCEP